MNKIIKSKWNLLLVLMLAVFQFGATSCKDSETGMGTPEITGVRVCDPEKADSLFTKSSQGQMIAIIGHDLSDAQEVYIAGQKVSFSTTMNTDHSIIVTVPSETDDFDLSTNTNKTIRVITSHGEATYDFTVLAQSPVITRIQGEYPRKAGDVLNIYGYNLFDIQDMYFTSATTNEMDSLVGIGEKPAERVQVADYSNCTNVRSQVTKNQTTYYQTTSQMSITTPDMSFDKGTLVIECGHGTTYISYGKTPGVPVINYVSSDMPEVGEELVLAGREFVQVSNITYGDVSLDASQFTVAESEDTIRIQFNKAPSVGSNGLLSVTTPGGTTSVSFYDRDFLLTDLDDETAYANMGWDPKVEILTTTPYGGTGSVAHFNSYGQWWGQMLFFSKDWTFTPFTLPSYDKIPADASADDVYIACEVYDNNSDFNNGGAGFQGFLRVTLWGAANNATDKTPDVIFHNFAWDDYDAGTFTNPYGPILQDVEGVAHKGKWYRAVIKLSDMYTTDSEGNASETKAYSTYKDFVDRGVSILRIMSYTQGTKTGTVDVYMDNVRLFYNKK